MATVTADRAADNVSARSQVSGVWCEVSTYELSSTASGTVIQLIKVANGSTLVDGYINFDALGGSTTVDAGDGDNDDQFISATDTSSAGLVRFGESGLMVPKTYTADDTLDCTLEGATGTGTLTMVAYFTREAVDLA